MGWGRDGQRGKTGHAVFAPRFETAYADALACLNAGGKMRSSRRLRGTETSLLVVEDAYTRAPLAVILRYWNTDIIEYHADGTILIRNGGFNTPSTRQKIETYVPGLRAWSGKPKGYERDTSVESVTHLAWLGNYGEPDHDWQRATRYSLQLDDKHPTIKVWAAGEIGYGDEAYVEVVARQAMVLYELAHPTPQPPRHARRRVLPGQLPLPLSI